MLGSAVVLTAAVPLTGGISTNFMPLLKAPQAAKTEPPAGATVTALQFSLPAVE